MLGHARDEGSLEQGIGAEVSFKFGGVGFEVVLRFGGQDLKDVGGQAVLPVVLGRGSFAFRRERAGGPEGVKAVRLIAAVDDGMRS